MTLLLKNEPIEEFFLFRQHLEIALSGLLQNELPAFLEYENALPKMLDSYHKNVPEDLDVVYNQESRDKKIAKFFF